MWPCKAHAVGHHCVHTTAHCQEPSLLLTYSAAEARYPAAACYVFQLVLPESRHAEAQTADECQQTDSCCWVASPNQQSLPREKELAERAKTRERELEEREKARERAKRDYERDREARCGVSPVYSARVSAVDSQRSSECRQGVACTAWLAISSAALQCNVASFSGKL